MKQPARKYQFRRPVTVCGPGWFGLGVVLGAIQLPVAWDGDGNHEQLWELSQRDGVLHGGKTLGA